MLMKLNENDYSCYIYRNLICLAILLHFDYTLFMGILHYGVPSLYSICSVLFYIGMLLLVMKRKRYALTVSLIHLETICFAVLHTVLSGWSTSFFFSLIAVASLVCFCPYRNSYIPYLPFIPYTLTFFPLHEQTQEMMFSSLPAASLQLLSLCNSFGSFLTILYVTYVSNANADIGKEVSKKQNEGLLQIVNYDSLTGLYSRIYLKKTAFQLCPKNCCLTVNGIDGFKWISNTYGHLCKDAILKQLVGHVRTRLNLTISICRWGGEEFVFPLHDIREQGTPQWLQDLCHWVNRTEFQYSEQNIPVTVTFGACRHQRLSLDELINKADQLLYQGK